MIKKLVSAEDVLSYILEKNGPCTSLKAHMLLYYSQAWSLVWDEAPLFFEEIQSWDQGPIIPDLYKKHREEFKLFEWVGDSTKLEGAQKETVDSVLNYYGNRSTHWLIELTKRESPWQEARRDFKSWDKGINPITLPSMIEYYSSL